MSKRERLDLKTALHSFGVNRPLRIPPQLALQAPVAVSAVNVAIPLAESIGKESVSKTDSVQIEQGSKQTVSKMDTVQNGPSPAKVVGGFTAVPHPLLRGESPFEEPIDFMIFMHLFTYSHGFGRDTATMGQAQLERFTGSGKNTVKRSLDRLQRAGWIKCIEEYEHSRMSRKWRVKNPPESKLKTLSKSDSVQNEQGPERTQGVSKMDTVTVSILDPFLERTPKETTKNSFSLKTVSLQKYFSELRPAGKRDREWQDFQGLLKDYSEAQVAQCFETLRDHGVGGPGTRHEPCHSPMAYLGVAMAEVLARIEGHQQRETQRKAREDALARDQQAQAEREAREALEWARKEQAFNRTFQGPERQTEVIAEICRELGMPASGVVARNISIEKWWAGLSRYDRGELGA